MVYAVRKKYVQIDTQLQIVVSDIVYSISDAEEVFLHYTYTCYRKCNLHFVEKFSKVDDICWFGSNFCTQKVPECNSGFLWIEIPAWASNTACVLLLLLSFSFKSPQAMNVSVQ